MRYFLPFLFAVLLIIPTATLAGTPSCGPHVGNTAPVAGIDAGLRNTSCPNGLTPGCTVSFRVRPVDGGGSETEATSDPDYSCSGPASVTNDCLDPVIRIGNVTAATTVTCRVTIDGVTENIDLKVYPIFVPPPPLQNAPPGPVQSPSPTGPMPSVQGVPVDKSSSETLYCAYKGEDGRAICICSTEAAAAANNCASVEFCATKAVGGCLPTKLDACTGQLPLGPEGIVVNRPPQDIGGLIQDLFTWSLSIVGLAMFLTILYSGFEWLLAAGNPGKISRAKGRITNAVMGAVLLLSSYIILEIINPDLVGDSFGFDILGVPASPRPTPAIPHVDCAK